MADDNTILEVGALVDLSQFTPKMEQMVADTNAATAQMSSSFTQLGQASVTGAAQASAALTPIPPKLTEVGTAATHTAETSAAGMRQISSSASGLRGVIQEFAIGVVTGMREASASIAGTAQTTTASTGVIGKSFTFLRALIQQFATGMVEGMDEASATVAKTTTTTVTNTGEMGSAWQRLGLTIREVTGGIVENLGEVGAKMSETAERSRLGVGTMETAFSGLSRLLGAGIAVGFAAHFLDESARVVIELEHLKTITGISIESLAGLRAVSQQLSIPFEGVQTALSRMQRAQVLAIEGDQMLRVAFQGVGISLDELKTLSPEQLFFALAKGISEANNQQVAVTSSMQILGRGAYTLIPLLREYGGTLQQMTAEAGKNSGVTDQAAEAAMRWHKETAQLSQLFQAAMIPVLQKLVDWMPIVAHGFDMIGAAVLGILSPITALVNEIIAALAEVAVLAGDVIEGNFRAIPGHIKHYFEEATGIAKTGLSGITDNFKAARADWDAIFAKEPPKTFMEHATAMLKSLEKPAPTDLSNFLDLGKTGKSDIVAKWHEQLDQLRDAQTGFHELSKAEEAEFWKSKLDIAAKTPAVFRQVYHEYVTAEREARKQSLSDEVAGVEQRVAAERSGSVQRVIILQEELSHLKAIHAEETSEYKRLQSQLITAQREVTVQDQREFVRQNELLISSTQRGSQERIDVIQRAIDFIKNLYPQETEIIERLEAQKTVAVREAEEQRRRITETDIDATRAHEQSLLDIKRSSIATQASLGLISNAQRIALDRQVITEETNLERQALESKLALAKQEPLEYERIKKQLLALDDKYNRLMAESDNAELKSRFAGWQRFGQQLESDWSRIIGQMLNRQRTFGQALAETWNQMVVSFATHLTLMLARWAATWALAELLQHSSMLRSIVQHLAGITTKIAAETAANSQRVAQTVAANTAMATSDAAFTTAHVAGAGVRAAADIGASTAGLATELITNVAKITSEAGVAGAAGFASTMVALPFPVNIATAPGVMAAAIAATLSNVALGSAQKGAVLDRDTLVAAHAQEMILPPAISTGLQNVVAAGGFNPPPALTQNFSTGGARTSSSSTVNNHYRSVHVNPSINVQVSGSEKGMQDLHERVVKEVKSAIRRGSLTFEEAV